MKLITFLIKGLLIYFFCLNILFASMTQQNFVVPFENMTLNPGGLITANFAFGPFSVIFCFDNTTTQNIGVITWPYKGRIFQSTIPIFLKTRAEFTGSFADPIGTLTILNNTGAPLVLSCLFAY